MEKIVRKIMLLFLVVTLAFSAVIPAMAASDSKKVTSTASAKTKYGWFKKNGSTYYRKKDGTLYKNTIVKIGKSFCSFDKKGRLKEKNTRYATVKLTIVQKDKTMLVAKDGKKDKYWIFKSQYPKINGKASFSKLKKGQKLTVIYDGSVLEVYPLQFSKILKVTISK